MLICNLVFTLEPFHPSGRIHDFLFASKEGMAFAAQLNAQVFFG
jgi:hypothetical protein